MASSVPMFPGDAMSIGIIGAIVLCAFSGGLSWWLTRSVRRYAMKAAMLDVPGARSSHVQPTPRGGGAGFVIAFLVSLPILASTGALSWVEAVALFGSGGMVAVIGFCDDRSHIPARWRLLVHFFAALGVVSCLAIDGTGTVGAFGGSMWVGGALAMLFLVWMLNLFNFMDGIDGIAGVEAITVCASAGVFLIIRGQSLDALVPLTLACATAGFLCWNAPRARIFMGDVGSGFLGIVLGIMALQAAQDDWQALWVWLILLAVFITDATWTLIQRLIREERVTEAHRKHAYQKASRRFGAHMPVTGAVALINLLWLAPWAMAVGLAKAPVWLGFAATYGPLAYMAYKIGAGKDD